MVHVVYVRFIFLLFYILTQIGPKYSGPIAMVINIIQYAAPAQNILQVFKTKDYTLIPISSVISGLGCSFCWLVFGILIYVFYGYKKNRQAEEKERMLLERFRQKEGKNE